MKRITKLEPNEIFVFGSNLAGRHGKGAALDAFRMFGAKMGVGTGRTGQCYAIATKDSKLKTCSLSYIKEQVFELLKHALYHPNLKFIVTPIGCGLAGYRPEDIAPMFSTAPRNIILPEEFTEILKSSQRAF